MYIGFIKSKEKLRQIVSVSSVPEQDPNLDFIEIGEEINLTSNMFWDTDEKKVVIVENKEEVINKINAQRRRLLSESDWTILPDAPFTAAQKKKWKEYRQALRDITKQKGFPENVVFPEKP